MIPTDEDASGEGLEQEEEKEAGPPQEPASEQESQPEIEVPPSDPTEEGESESEEEVPPSRFYRFAKKLMDRKELAEDTKDLMVAVLSTSDRAKTEMVRMTAREVRNYLDELRLKEELVKLVRSHSLEVKASFSLKPIEGMLSEDNPEEEED